MLGPRLVEASQALLAVEGRSAEQILGYPDDLKLRSSMTLFAEAADDPAVFQAVLELLRRPGSANAGSGQGEGKYQVTAWRT